MKKRAADVHGDQLREPCLDPLTHRQRGGGGREVNTLQYVVRPELVIDPEQCLTFFCQL